MNYRKIFSVVTEHTASTVTAHYAISLATACQAELVFYAAHDEGCPESIILHTDRHLDHLFNLALELNIPVTRITEAGRMGKLLPIRVQKEQADLLFYPLTPDEQYGANLQRHMVHHLLRTIDCDISILRVVNMAKPHPRHILMPLGKTIKDSERRLNFIAELARGFHSQVTLFHLSSQPGAKEMPAEITRFRRHLQQRHVTVLERRGSGEIGRFIAVEAITRHYDLIVLGATERGVLQRLFFGNPAGEVMHQPPCNTILFQAAR